MARDAKIRWLAVPAFAALLRAATPGHAATPATVIVVPDAVFERLGRQYLSR